RSRHDVGLRARSGHHAGCGVLPGAAHRAGARRERSGPPIVRRPADRGAAVGLSRRAARQRAADESRARRALALQPAAECGAGGPIGGHDSVRRRRSCEGCDGAAAKDRRNPRGSPGRRIAHPAGVSAVYIVLNVIGFVLCAYWASTRSKATLRSVAAYCIALPGLIVFVSGFAIGVREDARGRYGRVVTGVVTHKYNWTHPADTGASPTPQVNPGQPRPILASRGSGFYDLLPYVILAPSPYT